MHIQSLIAESKARFNHNSAKNYLIEKYNNKLFVAEQNGLWKADSITISTLQSFKTEKLVLIDTYNIPVEVDRETLLNKLLTVYQTVMTDFYNEWKDLEAKR